MGEKLGVDTRWPAASDDDGDRDRGQGRPRGPGAGDAPTPAPGQGQILIKVEAAGVNRPDVLQRKGFYPPPKGHTELPGLEVAGEVAAGGPGTSRFRLGDRVMALVTGGGYATYCVADEGSCLPVPPSLSLVEAAACPRRSSPSGTTCSSAARLKSGEWLLVHGGTSGIGVTAIQLAKALGAKVITTAGSDEKCGACRELGAERAVNYRSEDFVDAVAAETEGRGVDVILDMVGGDYVERNIRSLADDGRLVNIGYQEGSKVTLDLMRVMLKRLTLTGSTLRIRPNEVKAAIARAVEENVLPLLADGRVKVIVDRTYPLSEAAEAHRRMESSEHIGKIVLVP